MLRYRMSVYICFHHTGKQQVDFTDEDIDEWDKRTCFEPIQADSETCMSYFHKQMENQCRGRSRLKKRKKAQRVNA